MTEKESGYIVETGVSIPRRKATYDKYPFATMQVGDSFKVKAGIENLDRVRSAASRYAAHHPDMKFSTRIIDPIKNIYRCWRIK